MRRSHDRRSAAFTLLEVMIAVAILALGMTAIFASEMQSIDAGTTAQGMNIATMLARCKMGEIEEEIAEQGLPAVDARGRDDCCVDAEVEGFECEWKLERVVLPDDMLMGEESEEGAGDLLGDPGSQTGAIDGMLSGASPIGATGDDAMASMAIGIAFPVMKPAIEEQVRRATVTVKWAHHRRDMSFDVMQYIVAEQALVPDEEPTP
jgi:general secretion pathway protein I